MPLSSCGRKSAAVRSVRPHFAETATTSRRIGVSSAAFQCRDGRCGWVRHLPAATGRTGCAGAIGAGGTGTTSNGANGANGNQGGTGSSGRHG